MSAAKRGGRVTRGDVWTCVPDGPIGEDGGANNDRARGLAWCQWVGTLWLRKRVPAKGNSQLHNAQLPSTRFWELRGWELGVFSGRGVL
jgi:hypothetical protein